MTTLNVQFADSTESTIVSYFAGQQDPAVYPNQGTVEPSDARWKTFYDEQGSLAQQYLPAPETA